ncbi:MAG: phosphomannomutase [Phototrophicales bacterium]|nr:MAG: phosphomannomutase [Phototrophicales bacterium]RMG71420.1 MAG: phosphomannomutase/phosphoglucomutase [Chloroflexota bacterium]
MCQMVSGFMSSRQLRLCPMKVSPKLFKKYDIRGKALGDDALLTREAARWIGQAFATYLQQVENIKQVVVGRDNRLTSFDLQQAVMAGLRASGCDVIDLGMVATPIVYWHAIHYGNCGGVMVTGSHLPPDQNGFKLCIGGQSLYGESIQVLYKLIENGRLYSGDGKLSVDHGVYSRYIHDLTGRIPPSRPLKVVIDAGNGVAGVFAPKLFEGWGHQIVGRLYLEPDGNYPNHQPNPQEEANMRDLGAKVREVGADVGIAFDGDADRMGAVDEHGEMIAADRLLALLAVDMLKRHPGAALVADVLSSQVLFDTVKAAGGLAFMAASGHSLVKEAMRDKSALLGGEMSGHIFLAEDYFGFDDGFFAAGRLLQFLAESDQTLSELNAALPTLYSTPEYRPKCADEHKQAVIDSVAAKLQEYGEVETVDGFRLSLPTGWGILRASNTEPVLSLRFEGQTEADALAIRGLFEKALAEYGITLTS